MEIVGRISFRFWARSTAMRRRITEAAPGFPAPALEIAPQETVDQHVAEVESRKPCFIVFAW
jgi:hypothetical protein